MGDRGAAIDSVESGQKPSGPEDTAGTSEESHPILRPEDRPPSRARTGHSAALSEHGADDSSVGAPSTFSTGLHIDESSDGDSSVGDLDRPSSSVSATSSVFDFVEEHGRTFHRYKAGKYMLPNDIPERERLDLQHAIAVRLFGKLALAPINNPPRVLDIGTGTGIWAIEFANEHPASDVLGTDLSPIQPEYVPPNCHFEVDDSEDVWVFNDKFDYIHSRYMVAAFSDWPKIFRSCYENLNPGGWAEFQEYYVEFQCIDDSLAGTSIERWNKLILEAVEKTGRNGRAAAKFRRQLADAGFVDVVERKFALPGNAWAKGENEKMLGLMQMTNMLDGLHGMSMQLFTRILGWSAEAVEVFLVEVRKDFRNRDIHFYFVVYDVYGRKPSA